MNIGWVRLLGMNWNIGLVFGKHHMDGNIGGQIMGEMADLELDRELERISYIEHNIKCQIETLNKNLKNKIWVTNNGRHLKIKDMDNRHLRNTINMLSKNINSHQIIPELKKIKDKYIKLMRKQLNKNLKKIKVATWDTSQG